MRGNIKMNVVKDGYQIHRIQKEEIDGAVAPIYLLGLPGDIDKLKVLLEDI